MKPNLFKFGTSELTHDAILAWCLAWGNYKEEDLYNLSKDFMEKDDLIKILSLTENGFEDIIATRGKTYASLNYNFDELGLEKAFELIQENPRLLKRPLIFDEDCLLIGFNEDGIRAFIPPEVRRIELRERLILV